MSTTPAAPERAVSLDPGSGSARKSQARALLVFIIIMLGIAGGTGWLVARGLARGETWFPSKHSSQQRVVDRAQEPVMFWLSLVGYGVLCCGATGFAAWLAREGMRAPDGVFRRPGLTDPLRESFDKPFTAEKPMTLDGARLLVAQTQSPAKRAAAEQLLNEAIALPHLPSGERDAAIARIRRLDPTVPDYQLQSFGARVLEIIGDSLTDLAFQKVAYAEALNLAEFYASGASSGGEGTARSVHVREIEAKLQALEPGSRPTHHDAIRPSGDPLAANQAPPPSAAPPPLPRSARRPAFLTAVGWIFIGLGAIATPVSLISLLMILAGGDGTANTSLDGGLIVIGGPPATLTAGIGLLRRQRWAYGYALALLGGFAAYNLVQIIRGSTPERSTVSPSGLITTELASSANYPLHFLILAICVGLLMKLRKPAIRAEFSPRP
jgi:hypothetical protein